MQPKSKLPIQIGVGVVVILLYFGVMMYLKRDTNTDQGVVVNAPTTNTNTASQQPSASGYKNGTYSAVGAYISPGGKEDFAVTVTLADGKITDSTVNPASERPLSLQFQNDFAANYKQFVIGKSIADLKLSKVSGSSLTPIGFNDALEKIKAQAAS